MDIVRFDRLTRAVSTLLSRRTLVGGLGLAALAPTGLVEAKKKKRKKKRVKRNDFGCVDVGKFCKNGGQCCSGICSGKKDKKKCQAHNESTCQSGQREGICGGDDVACQTAGGQQGQCDTTTGKAAYCTADGNCFACNKDADCIAQCGPKAACIECAICTVQGVQTACVGPEPNSCIVPM